MKYHSELNDNVVVHECTSTDWNKNMSMAQPGWIVIGVCLALLYVLIYPYILDFIATRIMYRVLTKSKTGRALGAIFWPIAGILLGATFTYIHVIEPMYIEKWRHMMKAM